MVFRRGRWLGDVRSLNELGLGFAAMSFPQLWLSSHELARPISPTASNHIEVGLDLDLKRLCTLYIRTGERSMGFCSITDILSTHCPICSA